MLVNEGDMLNGPANKIASQLDELGEPLAEFAVRKRRLIRGFLLGPVLCAVGSGFFYPVIDFQKIGGVGLKFFVVFGVLSFMRGGSMVLRAWRSRNLRVLVFPEGVVRIQGTETETFFWDHVETVWRKRLTNEWRKALPPGTLVYSVDLRDGRTVEFDDHLPDFVQLAELIERYTFSPLMRPAQTHFDAGQTVIFGRLRLNQQGLSNEKETLPWHQIKSIDITREGQGFQGERWAKI